MFTEPKQTRNFIFSNTCVCLLTQVKMGAKTYAYVVFVKTSYNDIFQCGSLIKLHPQLKQPDVPAVMNGRKNKGFQLRETS